MNYSQAEHMKNNLIDRGELKKLVACRAVDELVQSGAIFSGMKIGLGTGSTAVFAVRRLAELITAGTLKDIKAVPTSFQTSVLCEDLGIPVCSLNDRIIGGELDLAIDGADEISLQKHLIKGGGAAHLLEKIAAYNSKRFVVIADGSKEVTHPLGTVFPLPVEVVNEARASVTRALEKLGASVTLREGQRKAGPVITDKGNLVLDCLWPAASAPEPALMEQTINAIPGVVENGFFTQNIPTVYIARDDGTIAVY